MKWIEIVEQKLEEKKRKTKIFKVKTKEGDLLGIIKWYGAWRKYCFFPVVDVQTVYEWDCLKDIADFLQSETKKYKRG